jgi:signal transduction histidine kinase
VSAQGPVERLGVIVHELRSPVAALTALAAAGRSVPPADRPRLVSLAVAAARDIERILSDPQLISLRLEAIDVVALVDGLRTHAVTVTVAVTGRPRVVGDRTRLRQILANLAQNGLRHGSNVLVEVGERDGLVLVDVVDDGPGVEAGVDVFARGSSRAGSSGLGLWLSRAIAEAHGGTLDLVSGPGPGARFRLSLPSASAAG